MVPERIDLPSHALYPESKVTSKSVMGAGRFTDVYQGRMQIEATKKERLVVTKCTWTGFGEALVTNSTGLV